jgi:hypothetical protein
LFVVVAIPLVDVRTLVAGETGRTSVPFWPDPEFGDEFLRGFGSLRPRPRRGVSPWVGEANYVAARHGIKLGAAAPASDGSTVIPIYRRIYSDGVIGRLEVGFRVRNAVKGRVDRPSDIWDLTVGPLSAAATISAEVGPEALPVPLIDAGDLLAESMLLATTSTPRRPAEMPGWWVSAGAPLLLHETQTDEMNVQEAVRSRIEDGPPGQGPGAVLVNQRWLTIAPRRVSGWSLVSGAGPDWAQARQVRVHVTRIHAGLEALRVILRLVRSRRLGLERAPQLYDFLDRQGKLMLRRQFGGLANRALLEQVLDTVENAYADELVAINDSMDLIVSKGLRGQLSDVGEMLATAPRRDSLSVFLLSQGSVINLDKSVDSSISVSGGVVGQAQAGQGNTQSGDVQQAVTSADLRALLRALDEAVSALSPSMAPADLAEGRDLVEVVRGEIESGPIDEPRLRRWLGKLGSWAEQIGAVAEPVLSLVVKITKTLG